MHHDFAISNFHDVSVSQGTKSEKVYSPHNCSNSILDIWLVKLIYKTEICVLRSNAIMMLLFQTFKDTMASYLPIPANAHSISMLDSNSIELAGSCGIVAEFVQYMQCTAPC